MTENDKQLYQLTQGVTRIANYMHEILLLVKKDPGPFRPGSFIVFSTHLPCPIFFQIFL